MKNTKKQNSGFTLIEIMVATSIFMMIMLIALGALISSSDTSKKTKALRSAMDNVNFAMESMTRSLRMGADYYCVDSGASVPFGIGSNRDCLISGAGGGAILFTPANHSAGARDTAYLLYGRGDSTFGLQKCTVVSLASTCVDVVSSDVDIKNLTFFVNGSSTVDTIQPNIYIIMRGTVKIKGVDNDFAIQTMVSQRSAE